MFANLVLVVGLSSATTQLDGGQGPDADGDSGVIAAEVPDAGVVVPTAARPAEALPAPGFDLSATLWGPGRKSSGEVFRSAATTLEAGPLRWRWNDFSLGLGLQYFARAEARDNADFNTANRDFGLLLDHRARVTARASAFGRVGAVVELQDVRGWGTEPSTTALLPAAAVHQGFVDVRAGPVDVRVGRQELSYGEDRLIGSLDWAQTARAFDGVFLRVTPMSALTVDAFGMLLKPPAFLTDSGGARFQNSGSYFTGVYTRYRRAKWGLDVYALGLLDDPSTATTGFRPDHNRLTLGGRGFVPVGPLSFIAEGALQLGVSSAKERILAGAFAGRATWSLPAGLYVTGDVSAATGDGTPGDGTESTFHQLFPTAHIHLGYIDYVGWQNVVGVRGTAGFKQPWLHVWLDVHHLRAWDPRGAWYAANGSVLVAADPTRTAGVMGNEVDLSVTVPLAPSVALAGAVSVFFPGGMQGASSNPSSWGFVYVRSQL
ncbi:MAG: alginate export family protein [Myxococcaceae bacterium]|nr:alginate export family protein [Myxococcaceae bacterium]